LGRGSRRGDLGQVGLRLKVPIAYNGAPQIRPHKYFFPIANQLGGLGGTVYNYPSTVWGGAPAEIEFGAF